MRVDNWEVQIERVAVAEQMESSVTGQRIEARGRFALVFLAVTNRGLRPDTFVAFGTLEIEDAEGSRSEEDTMASTYAHFQYSTDIGANINPGETVHVVAGFDVSESSHFYQLVPGSLARAHSGSIVLGIP
jgi:hypothetical protein